MKIRNLVRMRSMVGLQFGKSNRADRWGIVHECQHHAVHLSEVYRTVRKILSNLFTSPPVDLFQAAIVCSIQMVHCRRMLHHLHRKYCLYVRFHERLERNTKSGRNKGVLNMRVKTKVRAGEGNGLDPHGDPKP